MSLASPAGTRKMQPVAQPSISHPDMLSSVGLLAIHWSGVQVQAPQRLASLLALLASTDSIQVVVLYTHQSGDGFEDARAAV